MSKREDMEQALKTKIDDLLRKIEAGKARENELKVEIQGNYETTKKEEALLPQLHHKLATLEKTLEEKERRNDNINRDLRTKEQKAESTEEYWKREKESSDFDIQKIPNVRKEYGDVLIETNQLKIKSEDLSYDITDLEKQLREEEEICDIEEARVRSLQNELDSISQRLNLMQARQNDLIQRDEEQSKRLEDFKQRHMETENQAHQIENEVKTMEGVLENLTENLLKLKTEHAKLDTMLCIERKKMDERNTFDGEIQKTILHKAQKISTK